ncbi:MAG TPA: hypothetical protein VGA51_05615 [Casimicrobiaceae bacterium]
MKRTAAALIFGLAMIATAPCLAEDKVADVTDMQALRNATRADKRTLVESTLKLTPAEAKKFWPIYTAYQRSVELTDRRRNVALEGLVGFDRPLSDLYAKNLANEMIAADEAEMKARRTLQNRVMRALPAKKAARYLQLESKVRAVQAFDIAAAFPLVR